MHAEIDGFCVCFLIEFFLIYIFLCMSDLMDI